MPITFIISISGSVAKSLAKKDAKPEKEIKHIYRVIFE